MPNKNSKLEKLQQDLSELISSSKLRSETFHYPKQTSNRFLYDNIEERELISLLEEKKEHLRIMVEALYTYKENFFSTWLNLFIVLFGLISSFSAIVIPLAKGMTTNLYSYIISFGIIMVFIFSYLLIDRRNELKNKLYNIQLKRKKLKEAQILITYIEEVVDHYFHSINKKFL
ncbi:hypothetical protein [Emticicia fontis]